jgi:anti-sigma regulatory factor (Ser/Thr protein kinase)
MTSLKVLAEFKITSQPGNERKAVKQVAAIVAHLNLPANQIERLKTAVAEAVMNAMEHGNHYEAHLPVEVEVVLDETAPQAHNLIVRIRDLGGSQDIPASEPPDLEAKLAGRQSPRGWGLFLIKNMVDEMRVMSDGFYHTVELIFHLKGAA